MNDLHYAIKHTTLSIYADYTKICYAGSDVSEDQEGVHSDLRGINQWYEANEIKRNHGK